MKRSWRYIMIGAVLMIGIPEISNADSDMITLQQLKLYRPAYLKTDPSDSSQKIRDRNFSVTSKTFVKAPRQMVDFIDKDTFVDEYCGSYWTDLRGEINNARIYCSDASAPFSSAYNPPDIVAKVQARSSRGFKIYTGTAMFGDATLIKWTLDGAFVLRTASGAPVTRSSQSKFLEMGSWKIGSDSSGKTHQWAAALFEVLDWSYGTIHSFASAYLPESKWVLNYPFGAAFTHWDSVFFNSSLPFAYLMEAATHELGHVIYNKLHSSRFSYELEVLEYAHVHYYCSVVSGASDPEKFAQYEGNAHTTSALVWSLDSGMPADHPYGCSASGIDIEGNVDAFYFASLMGDDPNFTRPLETLNQYEVFFPTDGSEPAALRPLRDHYLMVKNAGHDSDSVQDMWGRYLKNQCRANYTDADGQVYKKYCNTEEFKDMVYAELFDEADFIF